MNAPPLLTTMALQTLLVEIRYTMSRLEAAAVLPSALADFQAARDTWTLIQAKEIGFHEDLSDADAQVDMADDNLDGFSTRFSQAILAISDQKGDGTLYLRFFKKPLQEILRPTLRRQLLAMDAWITSLQDPSTPKSLAAMLPELTTLVAAGKKAETLRDGIKLQIKQFGEVGERKQFIDHVNVLRDGLCNNVTKLALTDLNVPGDTVDSFFKQSEPTS
jgi:hypothetical protein